MKFKTYFFTALMALWLSFNVNAADFAHSTPAVQGYDVVSYQTAKRPVRGSGHFVSVYEGGVYQFSSADNKAVFDDDPAKYVPAYNGYCALGVSVGKKFIGDPEVWRVVENRLYLNLDANIQDTWLEDVPGRIEAADGEWKRIANIDPSSL